MTRQGVQSTNIRWKQWAGGAAGLLAAYTVAGFWLVPLLIKDQCPLFFTSGRLSKVTINLLKFASSPGGLKSEVQHTSLIFL